MRTTKRFTPKVLARFIAEQRGQGTLEDYIPWHRVSRSDPSSRGRSHLQMWLDRQRELLSDGEWSEFLFATSLPGLRDVREQFPLSLERAPHELVAYEPCDRATHFPGTRVLAEGLGIGHPRIRDHGEEADWVFTTDLLLAFESSHAPVELLAIAFKTADDLTNKRKCQLLRIEQEYWAVRGVPWLLITPELYDQRVALTLRRSMPWALGMPVSDADIEIAKNVTDLNFGCSLTCLIDSLECEFGDQDHGQRAFWQGVWSGRIPMDLRRGWRPHAPIVLLPEDDFWALNPIAARRSAWN